jgi:Xaa-Pro dipeptidase
LNGRHHPSTMSGWNEADLTGPDGEDWRVPVSELAARQHRLSEGLAEAGISGAFIQHPVDLYYYAGGRQNASMYIPACGAENSQGVLFVRRSLQRAQFEGGGDDTPHEVLAFPRMAQLVATLRQRGATSAPGLQFGEIPATYSQRFVDVFSELGTCPDVTALIHRQREIKSQWEMEQMDAAAEVQIRMFEAVETVGGEGISELELVAAAEAISRSEGFGGNLHMRRYGIDW